MYSWALVVYVAISNIKILEEKFVKKRTKLLIIIIVVIVLLIPYRITRYKDGGSVQYNGIFYEVVKYHSFNVDSGYNNGLSISVFGLTLFDNYN